MLLLKSGPTHCSMQPCCQFHALVSVNFIKSFPWKEQLEYFTIASSKKEFKEIFYNKVARINHSNQGKNSVKMDIFQNLFGKLDGNIGKRYGDKIKEIVK